MKAKILIVLLLTLLTLSTAQVIFEEEISYAVNRIPIVQMYRKIKRDLPVLSPSAMRDFNRQLNKPFE